MTNDKHTCSSQYKMRELPDPECAACMAEVSKKPPLAPCNCRYPGSLGGDCDGSCLCPKPSDAASLTERLIQAAVDYESGRCSHRELSDARAAVEAVIPDVAQPPAKPLRTSEKMLLEWLQKGDGQYGECQGDTLNDLIERGLAVVQGMESGLNNGFIAKGTDIMYRAVSITDAGRLALSSTEGK